MRLIDIDDVMIVERNPDVFIVPETAYGWNECLEIFRNAPAVDAVPVVRCKDCLHRDPEDNKCDCGGLEHAHIHPVADDWFCADGKRREVDDG